MRIVRGSQSDRIREIVLLLLAFIGAILTGPAHAGAATAAAQVCRNGICDGQKDPASAREDKVVQPAVQWNRKIELHVSSADGGMAWASIANGNPSDVVWLDRTYDGGGTWDEHLGITTIPNGSSSWRTMMYWIDDPARAAGLVRACGKAGDRVEVACTAWLPICRNGWCDGADPAAAHMDKTLHAVTQWGRKIDLHVNYTDGLGMAWANISNAVSGDQVWLDRSASGGSVWDPHLGDTYVPSGWTSWRTWMFSLAGGGRFQVRACGKAGNRPEVSCTAWLPVCQNNECDGADPANVPERAVNPYAWIWYRKITLHVRSDSRMAWASIDNGDGNLGDEVWIDRSWNGGASWDGRINAATIPPGGHSWRTWMYRYDDPAHGGTGLLRACGKAGDRPELACTPWVRATDTPPNLHDGAVDVLMLGYDPNKGMWGPGEPEGGIWLSANALTALIDYMLRTGDRRYLNRVNEIGSKHGDVPQKNFDDFYDDLAWWGLAWVRAYDLTGQSKYLDKARNITSIMRNKWNETANVCDGGVPWKVNSNVKNTITNALYMKLTASLYRRNQGSAWLAEAQRTWAWFRDTPSGHMLLVSAADPVRDGVEPGPNGQCVYTQPVGANTYTYLQGTLAGGLTELYRATGDTSLLDRAASIANVATSRLVSPSGVLFYGPEEGDDGLKDVEHRFPSDGTAFKGAMVRNLRELYDVSVSLGRPTGNWRSFLLRQVDSLTKDGRSGWVEFGLHWAGPIRLGHYVKGDGTSADGFITFGSQMSAVDAFNAVYGL